MAKTYYETTSYSDRVVDFTQMCEDYQWAGDYDIEEEGEADTDTCPGWSEKTATITYTKGIFQWSEASDMWIEITPTPSLILALEMKIESEL